MIQNLSQHLIIKCLNHFFKGTNFNHLKQGHILPPILDLYLLSLFVHSDCSLNFSYINYSDFDRLIIFYIGFLSPKKLLLQYSVSSHNLAPPMFFFCVFVMSSSLTCISHVIYSKEDAHNSMIYSYQHGFSGFAALLTSSQAKKISGTHTHITESSYL